MPPVVPADFLPRPFVGEQESQDDSAARAEDLDEAAVRAAKEEAERILAGRGEAMEIAEAQQD